MALTFHHIGADEIPRTPTHALLHTEELRLLRFGLKTIWRRSVEIWCDAMHERLTVEGAPHVCQVNPYTETIQQIWVINPKAIGSLNPSVIPNPKLA